MRVFRWTADFDPSVESPLVPVWVWLEGLPIHLFDKPTPFSIAKLLGSPLQTDAATVNLSRRNVARVCVEVNLSKELPKAIWIHLGYENQAKRQGCDPWPVGLFPSNAAVPTSTTPITFGSLETGQQYVTTRDIGPCPPPRLDSTALAPPTDANLTLNGPTLTGPSCSVEQDLSPRILPQSQKDGYDPNHTDENMRAHETHSESSDGTPSETTVPPIGNDDTISDPSTHTKVHSGKDDEGGKDALTEAEPISPHTQEGNTNISFEPRSFSRYIKVTEQRSSPSLQEFQKLSFTEQIAELKRGHQQLNFMQPKNPFQSIQGIGPKHVDANLFEVEVLQDHDENETYEESDPETPTIEIRHKGEPPDMIVAAFHMRGVATILAGGGVEAAFLVLLNSFLV
ncbi:unnamed protein product [Cuscuta campestris]|uniref:Uncharacterized protein n=1 Tax=Cuscuta campestris TaxID=132261 RepID=A0A484N7A5_9ASTE|nr:unnamed protein product [Cuscuta campestris]